MPLQFLGTCCRGVAPHPRKRLLPARRRTAAANCSRLLVRLSDCSCSSFNTTLGSCIATKSTLLFCFLVPASPEKALAPSSATSAVRCLFHSCRGKQVGNEASDCGTEVSLRTQPRARRRARAYLSLKSAITFHKRRACHHRLAQNVGTQANMSRKRE